MNPNCETIKSISQPISNGIAEHNSVNCNGDAMTNSTDVDDSVFKFESSKSEHCYSAFILSVITRKFCMYDLVSSLFVLYVAYLYLA